MNRDDLTPLAFLCCFILACSLIGMAVAITGHKFTEFLWLLGATELPAEWIAYGAAFLGWCVVGFSVGGRLVNQVWWWRDGT